MSFQAELRIGSKCNANCPYCFSKKKYEEDVDFERIFFEFNKRVIQPYKIKHLVITGGEPGLYIRELKKGVKYINEDVRLIMYSNGTILNENWFEGNRSNISYQITVHECFYEKSLEYLSSCKNRTLDIFLYLILKDTLRLGKVIKDLERYNLFYAEIAAIPVLLLDGFVTDFNVSNLKEDFLNLSQEYKNSVIRGYLRDRTGMCTVGRIISFDTKGATYYCSDYMYKYKDIEENKISWLEDSFNINKFILENMDKCGGVKFVDRCKNCYHKYACSYSSCVLKFSPEHWCKVVRFFEEVVLKQELDKVDTASSGLILFDLGRKKCSYAPNFHLFFEDIFSKKSQSCISINKPLVELQVGNRKIVEEDTLNLIKHFFKNSDLTEHILFNMTENCNLKCSYCYASVGIKDINSEFVFDTINTYEPKRISFLGGEPLLNKQIILDCLEKYPDKEIDFVTNGTIVDLELFEKFKQITVSIDCPDKDDRVFIQGTSSFQIVKNNIKHILEHSNIVIELKVVLTNNNYRYWKIMDGLNDMNRISMHILFDHFSDFNKLFYEDLLDRMYFEFFEILQGTIKLQHSIFTSFPSIADENNLSYRIGSSCSVGRSLAFSVNKELFPCIEIASNNKFKDMVTSTKEEIRDMTFQDRLIKVEKCSNCIIRYVCNGCLYFGDNEWVCQIKRRGTILATFLRLQKFENLDTLIEEQLIDRLHFLEKSDV